ncbi:DUF2891 domain-containing protein [Haloflavibacter putidus]|uniref:DUF2891 domain-containing protein n=1 Tax=Haloflavibacter putidus TaxID=2576776 RepID=A0A507ZQ49_9FLAO|nr:DUF2891 domain-containing protein [Haloflavibacter putidus]TQD39127.1 DUF2891 domain-containing protein [Haloflavibacter putidus]
MKKSILILAVLSFFACKEKQKTETENQQSKAVEEQDSSIVEEISNTFDMSNQVVLDKSQASNLAKLPLACIEKEYPNKLNQVLANKDELQNPKSLHPVFYGCFDWHSSVHGYWTMVKLLKQYPQLKQAKKIKALLQENITKDNINKELKYFKKEHNKTYERTYGWAWLLKLSEELQTWDDTLAVDLNKNLQPLTNKIVDNFQKFLPNLSYPIRVGEHQNTAFALSLAYDYAKTTKNEELKKLIEAKAREFYLTDKNCPIAYEPNGYDFFSPCLMEINLMQKILEESTFKMWLKEFMPSIIKKDFQLEPVEVTDRSDGKLVHLDGLNFSRAAVLFALSGKYKDFKYLESIAEKHLAASYENVLNDSYEGGHWLGTFALYALNQRVNKN